ncbi:MAG: hypothetical protein WAK26_19240 [Terracidiphilus sp.]
MRNTGWFSRLFNQQPATAMIQRIAGGVGVAVLMAGIAIAQSPPPQVPTPDSQMSIPDGYSAHGTADLGGHTSRVTGSKAMYDTLVNIQSGPRVLGESFEMHALTGNKHPLFDSLHAIGTGFGGDPFSFNKLDFHKGKIYEFSGTFRRDRDYFDYDLLGNPNVPTGQSIPIGPSNAPTGSFAWPQVKQSPVMFNSVRRMTDTNLTLYPISKVTFRAGYSQSIMQGPSLSPGESVGKYDSLLQEFQRNSTDDFTGAIDWKPIERTKLTFEYEINHYKENSYFTIAPSEYNFQEADGTKVSIGDWDSQVAVGIGACNTGSMGTAYTAAAGTTPAYYTILSAPQTAGGLPVINPACDVITSYLRSQPTRILTPTATFRFQSSSIKNVTMNGDFRFTDGNMNLPNYYENYQGLDGAARSNTFTAIASARRQVMAGDYGIVWQATKTFSLSDQVDYSNLHQPGSSTVTADTTLSTPTTVVAGNNGYETINYLGALIPTAVATTGSSGEGTSPLNVPAPAYFGQKFLTNNLTGTWDATSRATLSLTYRHRNHVIAENAFSSSGSGTTFTITDPGGNPGNVPLAPGATTNGIVTINEDGGILNAALRPLNNWDINGTVEILYDDNAFTPVGPRQTKHYRLHTMYKPRPWATISGAFNDLERHNNSNNNQAGVALFVAPSLTPTPNGTASSGTPYEGPLQHVDHSRVYSVGAALTPNEHYGFDFNYAYSDVYAATNICYLNGATATLPGAVQYANSTVCPNIWGRGATGLTEVNGSALSDWFARDFMDAPTQSASAALALSPVDKLHANIGYHINSVNGTRFFNDARDVNGSLVSTYQTPFVNAAWTVHTGLVLKAEYNFYGYGEGGPSGSQYCSTTTAYAVTTGQTTPGTPPTVVPCTSLTAPTGLTESPAGATAPRNFHANNVTIGVHFAF